MPRTDTRKTITRKKRALIFLVNIVLLTSLFTVASCSSSDPDNDDTSHNSEVGTDNTAPVISNIQIQSLSSSTARISWDTDESATSQVEYGLTMEYGFVTSLNSELAQNHSVQLTGLQPDTTYQFRVLSADSAANEATSENQSFTTSVQSANCTPGVDCYCDLNPQLLFCEDFSDGTFGSLEGSCSNNGGPWPDCSFISHEAGNEGGYRDNDNGISDDGAILSTILARTDGQVGVPLSMVLSSPLTDGEGSFSVLMKAGPTFWEAFSSANKFIAFRPTTDDPRQVVFMRPADAGGVNGCTPGTYSVPNASGGGGAAQSFDEFGNSNPFESDCQHSIKFGNNLAGLWVYIEWEIHSLSSGQQNVIHVLLQDGTTMTAYAPVTTNITQYSVELFHWQEEATLIEPDSGSYVYIDLLRVNESYMGPPPGFLE